MTAVNFGPFFGCSLQIYKNIQNFYRNIHTRTTESLLAQENISTFSLRIYWKYDLATCMYIIDVLLMTSTETPNVDVSQSPPIGNLLPNVI